MKRVLFVMFALVLIGSFAFGQGSNATVNQTGESQNAIVGQTGDNQVADITQSGLENSANVIQFTDNTGPQQAIVIQAGTQNQSIVSQSQTGGGNNTPTNTAYIEQVGITNIAVQSQTAPGYNSGQHVWGYQQGTSNVLYQTIASGHTESLTSEQYGLENIATQYAAGSHTHGNILQNGTGNIADQYLYGSNNGYMSAVILIDQYGTENYASQNYTGLGSSHQNNAEIYQIGSLNQAWQVGEGRDLDAILNQSGSDHWSSQTQLGDGHISNVTQSGVGHSSTVVQQSN
jgi:hypothetical protein